MITPRTLVSIGGFIQIGIVVGAIWVPQVMNWRRLLASLNSFMRRLFWIYAAFILGVNLGFAVISIGLSEPLGSGEPLARAVCLLIALYWGARLLVQLFVFDLRPVIKNRLAHGAYHLLTAAFTWLVVTYGIVAFWPQKGI